MTRTPFCGAEAPDPAIAYDFRLEVDSGPGELGHAEGAEPRPIGPLAGGTDSSDEVYVGHDPLGL